jgi:hypothetical protein
MSIPRPISRRRAVATLTAAGLGVACRGISTAPQSTASIDRLAERYVRLTLELAQHQPSLVEQWLGPDDWRPGARRPVAQIRSEIEALQAAIAGETAADADRVTYLRGQLAGLAVAARRLSGENMAFVDEASGSLGSGAAAMVSHAGEAGGENVARALADLERRLPGDGPLHERYKAYRVRHAIPTARFAQLVPAAVERCRARVRAHVELPAAEHVLLDSAADAGVEGRAQYDGEFRSRVWIAAGAIDLARLIWLVAHECYPGHHLQHVLADRDLVNANGWSERRLFPSFGGHLLCAEGAADAGADLLLEGGHFEEICAGVASLARVRTDDIADLVAVHRAVISLDLGIATVARMYLDGTLGREAAATRLHENALVLDPGPLLQVIERQRTRVLVYPLGRRLVKARLDAAGGASRWTRLAAIATTLTFAPGIARTGTPAITS